VIAKFYLKWATMGNEIPFFQAFESRQQNFSEKPGRLSRVFWPEGPGFAKFWPD
jgi:hypothetical protein